MTSRNRRKRTAENERWLREQNDRLAAAQRNAARDRRPVDGLRVVTMGSIAESLDEVDPKVRGIDPGRPKQAFVPPRFTPSLVTTTHQEEPAMAVFTSSQRVRPKKGSGRSTPVRVMIPGDVVGVVGNEKLLATDFAVELTDEGILLRPGVSPRTVPAPAWAK